MNSIVLVCLLAVVAMATARPGSSYTDRYDNINLDEILDNRRLLVPYLNCMLDLGRCSPEGKELKTHIREALEQNCAKCTPNQRSGSRRVIAHLINKEQDYWNKLVAKYDPQHKFTTRYETELRGVKA